MFVAFILASMVVAVWVIVLAIKRRTVVALLLGIGVFPALFGFGAMAESRCVHYTWSLFGDSGCDEYTTFGYALTQLAWFVPPVLLTAAVVLLRRGSVAKGRLSPHVRGMLSPFAKPPDTERTEEP